MNVAIVEDDTRYRTGLESLFAHTAGWALAANGAAAITKQQMRLMTHREQLFATAGLQMPMLLQKPFEPLASTGHVLFIPAVHAVVQT